MIEKPYVAALLENRGRIRITKPSGQRTSRQLEIRVRIDDGEVLRRLIASAGGTVVQPRRRAIQRRPCHEHCPEPHEHVTETLEAIQWHLNGVRAVAVLFSSIPYCLSPTTRTRFAMLVDAIEGERRRKTPQKVIDSLLAGGWDVSFLDQERAA